MTAQRTKYAEAKLQIDNIARKLDEILKTRTGYCSVRKIPQELVDKLREAKNAFAGFDDARLKELTGFKLQTSNGIVFRPEDVHQALQEHTGYLFKMHTMPQITADNQSDEEFPGVSTITPWRIHRMSEKMEEYGMSVPVEQIQALEFERDAQSRDEIFLVAVGLFPGGIWIDGIDTGRVGLGSILCKTLEEFRNAI